MSIAIPATLLTAILVGRDDGTSQVVPVPREVPLADAKKTSRALPGQLAPDFVLPGVAGEQVQLSNYLGRPVLLTFFASWCAPCEKELPALEQIARTHPDVAVVAVNFKDLARDSRKFVRDLKVTFPALLEDNVRNPVAGLYDVRWLPQTIFIDRRGVITDRLFGATSVKALQPSLDALLG